MEFTKPQVISARISDKYYLSESEKYLLVKIELIEPNKIEFVAGQYLNIKVEEKGTRRSYSILSTPDVDHSVTLLADLSPGGVGSGFLKTIQPGDEVELLAPLGRFVVDQQDEKYLFVATGSGIVPIMSMINDLLIEKNTKKQVRLHWGMRYESDVFWLDNLERLTREYPNFVFDLVLSKPNDGWQLCWGRVTDCLRRDIEDASSWSAYLCGNNNMLDDVRKLLIERGMSEEKIHTEKFY